MRKGGRPAKEIAERVVESRNAAKIAARKLMNPEDAATLAARNLEKYGNEVGPTVEQMLKEGRTYEQIIDSGLRTNSWYDWLFLLF